jgi:hypothetical protein
MGGVHDIALGHGGWIFDIELPGLRRLRLGLAPGQSGRHAGGKTEGLYYRPAGEGTAGGICIVHEKPRPAARAVPVRSIST